MATDYRMFLGVTGQTRIESEESAKGSFDSSGRPMSTDDEKGASFSEKTMWGGSKGSVLKYPNASVSDPDAS